jgi:glyoxylase-like metal-dependent hydrolase (beta-lactamase superfamily II)
MAIPYLIDFEPQHGSAQIVSPLVRRVVAPNQGPFTAWGTGSYIIGADSVAVIDPGPERDDHLAALIAALTGKTVSHILVTHTHLDHSPLARALADETGAPVLAFGPHGSGREAGLAGEPVEAGADLDFAPDHRLADGELVEGDGWTIEAVHTPGHTSNHLCFALREEQALFTGDHIMGWSTSIISPPDGDMAKYMASLDKLLARGEKRLIPCHGPVIEDPQTFIRALIAHRQAREAKILAALQDGVAAVEAIVARVYTDVAAELHPAAARSTLAHLIHLIDQGLVCADGENGLSALYKPA